MRVTDDRYARDRMRLDIALRLIRLEARTQTIRQWTGLTDDRIRKLYRSYARDDAGQPVARHRGKSPQQIAFFSRSAQLRRETVTLAAMLTMHSALPDAPLRDVARQLPSLQRAELLCSAYEAYRDLHAAPRITFEHAVFLLIALTRADELRVHCCTHCHSLGVVDLLAARSPRCLSCDNVLAKGLRERAAAADAFGAAASG